MALNRTEQEQEKGEGCWWKIKFLEAIKIFPQGRYQILNMFIIHAKC